MRIQDLNQRFRDFGELVVDLKVNARREKRERLQQALDMRIFAAIGFEDQP